jgi:two-component system, OmpR family, sensor kinase
VSLRTRLLLAVLSLVAAGLIVADAVTYTSLNSFLTARLDQQLVDAAEPTARFLSANPQPSPRPGRDRSPLPPGTYAALVDAQGAVTSQITFGFTSTDQASQPWLPSPLPSVQRAPLLLTVPGSEGSGDYRVVVRGVENGTSEVIVAIPLSSVEPILQRLLLLEIGVGVAVLGGLAALGAWAVRLGLRPLDRIAETAGAIAAGDLQRRVSPATTRTEVGRLGLALNAMLGKIEESFAARRASEDRLRRFVADASHELRTPVASIRGYAELFRRGAANRPDDLAMAMNRIEDEAGRMGHLVDDLLLLARLDEGRPLERAPVDLSQLASDAAADARAIAPDRPIRLDAAEDIVVVGDEPRLRQVVANLVRNALVHTPAATPVEISTRTEGDQAVLTVADHGPGVPPDAAAHVFERFYRADPARHDHGSSGLGLSIVAAVVAAHAGNVEVSRTPGGGATFQVELRLYGGDV